MSNTQKTTSTQIVWSVFSFVLCYININIYKMCVYHCGFLQSLCFSASRCRLITSNNSSKPSTSCQSVSVQEEEMMATLLGSEPPCTGGKRRNCNSNIITKFTASRITGQGFSRGTQVRETAHVSAVKTFESWSPETGDLRSAAA